MFAPRLIAHFLCVQPSTRYFARVRVIGESNWGNNAEFVTTDNVCFDSKASTQGGRVRLSNNDHSVVSSGGTAVAVSNVGFSRGSFSVTFVIQVQLSMCVCFVAIHTCLWLDTCSAMTPATAASAMVLPPSRSATRRTRPLPPSSSCVLPLAACTGACVWVCACTCCAPLQPSSSHPPSTLLHCCSFGDSTVGPAVTEPFGSSGDLLVMNVDLDEHTVSFTINDNTVRGAPGAAAGDEWRLCPMNAAAAAAFGRCLCRSPPSETCQLASTTLPSPSTTSTRRRSTGLI